MPGAAAHYRPIQCKRLLRCLPAGCGGAAGGDVGRAGARAARAPSFPDPQGKPGLYVIALRGCAWLHCALRGVLEGLVPAAGAAGRLGPQCKRSCIACARCGFPERASPPRAKRVCLLPLAGGTVIRCLQEQERLLRDKEKADARVAKEREKELARLEAERRKHFERVQKEQASIVLVWGTRVLLGHGGGARLCCWVGSGGAEGGKGSAGAGLWAAWLARSRPARCAWHAPRQPHGACGCRRGGAQSREAQRRMKELERLRAKQEKEQARGRASLQPRAHSKPAPSPLNRRRPAAAPSHSPQPTDSLPTAAGSRPCGHPPLRHPTRRL